MFVRISALASKKGQIKKNSLESVFLVNLVTPKEYFENNHNFLDFGHSKKFFTNLEMADQVKINDIKRFDEIWCLRQFATHSKVRFQKDIGKSDWKWWLRHGKTTCTLSRKNYLPLH